MKRYLPACDACRATVNHFPRPLASWPRSSPPLPRAAALPHMMNVLAGRPASFPSLEEAVTWAVRSGMSRNKEAAAVSMPGQLQQQGGAGAGAGGAGGGPGGGGGGSGGDGGGQWTWRTPLELSRPYWEGWYMGLSEAFLQVRGTAYMPASLQRMWKGRLGCAPVSMAHRPAVVNSAVCAA